MRSCMRRKYSNVCGTPSVSPVVRTGCTVIDALFAMKLLSAATANGMPME